MATNLSSEEVVNRIQRLAAKVEMGEKLNEQERKAVWQLIMAAGNAYTSGLFALHSLEKLDG